MKLNWFHFPETYPLAGKYCLILDEDDKLISGFSCKSEDGTRTFKVTCGGLNKDLTTSHNCCSLPIKARYWAYLPFEEL